MKKFLYLCVVMLLSMNMLAQIDPYDRNWDWDNSFEEEFNTNQSWNPNNWYSIPDQRWRAYLGGQITHGSGHQIYQYDHCLFNPLEESLLLVAEYDDNNLIVNHHYALPNVIEEYPNQYGQNDGLYYFSGGIGSIRRFRYGYFEIRCKLPVHHGAFPGFWLHTSSCVPGHSYYESLDILEYSWWITVPNGENPNPPEIGSKRCYTCGIHFNDTTCAYSFEDRFGKVYPIIPAWSSDLDDYHVFSCEWMPDRVVWYFDGAIMNTYDNAANIPHRSHELMANYDIDNYYNYGGIWYGPGSMEIDYIHAYQLKWDCETDELITCQSDLEVFDYAVKKTIAISSFNDETIIGNGDRVTFRITDSFEITNGFEVENGSEFTVIKQLCRTEE